jgi:TRAP-type C4-dicarboxylate transport system substrate-binding protein
VRRLVWIGAAALVAVVVLTVAACAGGNKAGGASGKRAIVLTFASTWISGEPVQLMSFQDELAKLSGGTIRIDFRGDWRAGDHHQALDTIRDVRAGKADLGWVDAYAWGWLGVHSFDPLIAPFLINSYPLEQQVFARGIPQRMLVGVWRAGVVGIGVLPGPMRKVYGLQRRLVSPADFQGVAFGVHGPLAAATLRALGARPRQRYSKEPLAGFGGTESPLLSFANLYLDSAGSYLGGNLNLWPSPLVLFASPKIFHSLSAAQQLALRQAGAAAVAPAMSGTVQDDKSAIETLCARHRLTFVNLTQAQLRALVRAVAPVYGRLSRDGATHRSISEIQALKRRTSPPPAIKCPRIPTISGKATPIDGTWQMTVPASQSATEAGTERFSLHHGRMRFSDVGPHGPPSRDTGTYQVSRNPNLVTFYNIAGHDAGGTSIYRWSLYRGELILSNAPNAPGPPNATYQPWHRVGR